MYALKLDVISHRILSATKLAFAQPDNVFVTSLPKAVEDYNNNPVDPMPPEADLHNYLYIAGYIYDPLPKPEPVDPGPSDHELLMALLGVTK